MTDKSFVTDIIDCKISLENLVNFRERRILDYIGIKVVIKLQGDGCFERTVYV